MYHLGRNIWLLSSFKAEKDNLESFRFQEAPFLPPPYSMILKTMHDGRPLWPWNVNKTHLGLSREDLHV